MENMNKEEALENLKHIVEYWKPDDENDELANIEYNSIKVAVELIDKLQKELKDSINARFELQRRIDKTQKENAELKEEIKDLIEENHKHIDYIANMKKKHEDKIRTKIKELENKKEQYSERPLIYNILKSQLEELLGDDE